MAQSGGRIASSSFDALANAAADVKKGPILAPFAVHRSIQQASPARLRFSIVIASATL